MAKKEDDTLSLLVEDLNEEIVRQLPEWFRVLRKAYKDRVPLI